MMVQSALPKNVFFSVRVCMHNAAYIFIFPVETADSSSGLGEVLLWMSRGGVINEGRLPPKFIFHWRSSFHLRLSSTKVHLPLKVVFQQKLSSTKGCLPPKVVFYQRSSSTEGRLPPKGVFHWRSSSTKGCLSLLKSSSYLRLSDSVLEFDNLNTYAGTISLS